MNRMLAEGVRRLGRGSKWALIAAVAASAALLAGTARESGMLEKLELEAYDHVLSLRQLPRGAPSYALVLENEADLRRYRHPLPDEVFVRLIERLLAAGASAIVIDKYRDIPIAPGTEELAAALAKTDRVIWLRKVADEMGPAVSAPPGVAGTARAACADVIADVDGLVRRHLVYLRDGAGQCFSLAFVATAQLLERRGVGVRFDQSGVLVLGSERLVPVDPGMGPFVKANLAGYQVPVEYALPGAPAISLAQVLEGRVGAEEFRGKMVFFGSSAASLRDYFAVPGGEGRGVAMSGAEVHAQAAATMLRAAAGVLPTLKLHPDWMAWAAVVVFALATAAAVILVPGWTMAALWVAIVAAIPYGAARGAISAGAVLPMVPAIAAVFAAALLAFAARAWREQAERAEMMNLFSRQVSGEVADAIWARREDFYRNGSIPSERLAATVLFLDIRSFTTTTERLGPDVVPWLNRGLGAMTDIVIRHHGVVTRFVGDQIMAVFGVPVRRMDDAAIREDAARAVGAALRINEALVELNSSLAAQDLPPIRVRIGINSGVVTQGAVGSRLRFEYTVLGDVVNTAARLESYATDDDGAAARVLIGESTYKLCGAGFRCEALGALQLKGKVETVSVYRVLGEAGAS